MLVTAVFFPVHRLGFVWDDFDYLHHNPLLAGGPTLTGAVKAFLSFHAANWHPVTWLSHMADLALFDWNPAGHHVTNLLLHSANAVLLFALLSGMTGRTWAAAAVAALFAVHPQRVESVAWIAERKDLLAACFGLGTLLAYLRRVRSPRPQSPAAAVMLYALGLATKPMLVTIPLLMLVLDWWPLGRAGREPGVWRPLLREKMPFVALSAASALVTLAAQFSVNALNPLPFPLRLANALHSYVAYLGAALWPAQLACLYPLRSVGLPSAVGAAVVLLLVTTVAVLLARRLPWILAGWAWYAISLVPVIGLVQVGGQAMADRYTYLSLTGILVAVVWSFAHVAGRRRISPVVPAAVTATVLVALTLVTRTVIPFWRNETTLWRRALRVSPWSQRISLYLGVTLTEGGNFSEAEEVLRAAQSASPHDARVLTALGMLQERRGERKAAIDSYRSALDLDNSLTPTRNNLGVLLALRGEHAEAEFQFREALRVKPEDAVLRRNLARALERGGNLQEAFEHYETALLADPGNLETRAMRDRVRDRLAADAASTR